MTDTGISFCYYNQVIRYAFDPAKQALNVERHRVWFHEAQDFDWETARLTIDARRDYGEARWTATGLIGQRLHVMVFTLRDTTVRLISLRKANTREIQRYVRALDA